MIGQTITHYRVTAKLGAGGMGEVYRATDTKLGRDVALKVLPQEFAQDPQRMARFQREAQVLASLNHPNIAAIHGLEHQDKVQALAMELVEGATLAERIAQGPLPLDEALPIARQIAEALEYAHERGIIHRDLKPANIKLTADGKVKILDFGLAKALSDDATPQDISSSPTLSMAATKMGMILGTAAYMSPEQAKGRNVDRRTDVWAFGCVLYEMLTAKRAFAGEDVSETLAAIIRGEPDWNALPAATPSRLRALLKRCMEKDAKRRLQAIGEARVAIDDAIADPQARAEAAATPAPTGVAFQRILPWALVGLLGTLTLWLAWRGSGEKPLAIGSPSRFQITLPQGTHLTALEDSNNVVAISPDGTNLVYAARSGGTPQLFLRPLGNLESRPIPGTEDARNPFFSHDGKWVAFIDGVKLKKVSVDGGSPLVLCDSTWGGGVWGANDQIIYTRSYAEGLWSVPGAGGKPVKLTEPDRNIAELGHWWPQLLPGGDAVLFTGWITPVEKSRLMVLSLKTGQQKVVLEGGAYGRYLPTGHLIFMRTEGLMAVPFDVNRLEVRGTPVRVSEDVRVDQQDGLATLSISAGGTLVYLPKASLERPNEAVWVNSRGSLEAIRLPARRYEFPKLSPDGQKVALTYVENDSQDVWVYDLARGTQTRVAAGPTSEFNPHWTPDGKRLIYNSERSQFDILSRAADGSGPEQVVVSSAFDKFPNSLSADGKVLVFGERNPATHLDIWTVSLEGEGKPEVYLNSPFDEHRPALSPDGRLLAYQSNVTGRFEIYVARFPGQGERLQVSNEGGTDPLWAKNGRELYFRNGTAMMASRVKTNPFSAEKPAVRFRGEYDFAFAGPNYDVTADGRFLMLRTPPESAPRTIVVVLNWFEELKRLAPIQRDSR